MSTTPQIWPPAYRLRKSRRAKYLQLKVCPQKGLEVVVPYRFGEYNLDDLLRTHRHWIEKRLKIFYAKVEYPTGIPDKIMLSMTDELWTVKRIAAVGSAKVMSRPDNTIILVGDVDDSDHCQSVLKQWLKHKAKSLLTPLLDLLSAETGLPYNKVTVRDQKSRWGSCSSTGNIALNYKLIFLPMPLARYVIIHELCHTRHFNHSKRFWALVAQFDPNFMTHRREINAGYRDLGPWGKASISVIC